MEHNESPLLSLTLQHRSKVGVVIHHSKSKLEDFTGLLYQGPSSHLLLNLTLTQASGTIMGTISGAHSIQTVKMILGSTPGNYSKQVKLSAMECTVNQINVTLHPVSLKNESIVRTVPCMFETLRTFLTSNKHPYTLTGQDSIPDCLGCSSTWLHWLNPDQWLNSMWPQARIIITVIMSVVVIITIFLIWRVWGKICKCIVPNKKNSKKKKILGDILLSELETAMKKSAET